MGWGQGCQGRTSSCCVTRNCWLTFSAPSSPEPAGGFWSSHSRAYLAPHFLSAPDAPGVPSSGQAGSVFHAEPQTESSALLLRLPRHPAQAVTAQR